MVLVPCLKSLIAELSRSMSHSLSLAEAGNFLKAILGDEPVDG